MGEGVAWHSLPIEEVFERLRSSPQGLSDEEAARRLREHGPNVIEEEKGRSPLFIFIDQFINPLMALLLLATALSLAIGEVLDAATILAIVLASSILGFAQEYRAEEAVKALKKMTAPTARVLRGGVEKTVPAAEVVPGDVLVLAAGDRVAADARVFESVNLKVDESMLTGESVTVEKFPGVLPPDTPLVERSNMVFYGTVVTYGKGLAVAVATGMDTQLGRIARSLQEVEKEKTPLERRMASIGRWLTLLMVVVASVVSAIGLFVWHYSLLDMAVWAISLAVAAVPEALPAVVTGALAIGMYRMARRNAVVKKLPAVETLGSTTYICSDKTGTMTKGEMTVKQVWLPPGRRVEVTGTGYEPRGEFLMDGQPIDPLSNPGLALLLRAALHNNDARVEERDGRWVAVGDPTEAALKVLAYKAGLEESEERVGEIPFSSERKRMSTIHRTGEGLVMYVKGAPEVVLALSSRVMVDGREEELTEEMRGAVLRAVEEMASHGLRNLGFAYKRVEDKEEWVESDETDLVFLGVVGMIDPPRPEVRDALALCRRAGIGVAMITGDHKLTAVAVARELGLMGEGDEAVTGAELDAMSEEELEREVERIKVYARVSPEHKLRIVKALKRRGHIVAMTGDGVNDAPALKAADIGVAMGVTGTEVAKEAADMILADDNFATIVEAVKLGREIFENIRKYIAYLLRCNITELLVPLVASLASLPLPFNAIQYLWINLVTDGFPAIALGVDPPDPDILERKPRKPSDPVFDLRENFLFFVLTPAVATAILVYMFSLQLSQGASVVEARTTIFTSLILMELLLALSTRSLRHTVFRVGVFKNKYLIAAILVSIAMQLAILYAPPARVAFKLVEPDLEDWVLGVAAAATVFLVLEAAKLIVFRRERRRP